VNNFQNIAKQQILSAHPVHIALTLSN